MQPECPEESKFLKLHAELLLLLAVHLLFTIQSQDFLEFNS